MVGSTPLKGVPTDSLMGCYAHLQEIGGLWGRELWSANRSQYIYTCICMYIHDALYFLRLGNKPSTE